MEKGEAADAARWAASPTATTSPPGPAPPPSTPPQPSRSGIGSPGPGTADSTTSCISPPSSSCATTPKAAPTSGQAERGQGRRGSHALPGETAVRRGLPAAPHRRRRRPAPAGGGPGRAQRGDSRIQRGRPDPARRNFGSATTRTRSLDATAGTCSRPTPRGLGGRQTTPARRRRQDAAPHRTNSPDADQRRHTLTGARDHAP